MNENNVIKKPTFKALNLDRTGNIIYVEESIKQYLSYRFTLISRWNNLLDSLKLCFVERINVLMDDGIEIKFTDRLSPFDINNYSQGPIEFSDGQPLELPVEWRMQILSYLYEAGMTMAELRLFNGDNYRNYRVELLPCVIRKVTDAIKRGLDGKMEVESNFALADGEFRLDYEYSARMVEALKNSARALFLGKVRAMHTCSESGYMTPTVLNNGIWRVEYPEEKVSDKMAQVLYYGILGLVCCKREDNPHGLTLSKDIKEMMIEELIFGDAEI